MDKKEPESVKETLEQALALVRHRWNWTRGRYHDKGLFGQDRYCILGALLKVNGKFEIEATHLIENILHTKTGSRLITYYNDRGVHSDVVALFEEAIEKAYLASQFQLPLNEPKE